MSIFYELSRETHVTHGNLPHWTQCGKMHFVTFRLADSLPQEKLKEIKHQRQQWILCHKEPYTDIQWREYNSLFTERIEQWIDAGHGECLLSYPQEANVVVEAIQFFEQQRYCLDYWVVMPNHVHVLMIPLEPYTLKGILHTWKSFTSKKINKLRGGSGEIWQHESFDHVVRSQIQLEKFCCYIIENWLQSNKTARVSRTEFELV